MVRNERPDRSLDSLNSSLLSLQPVRRLLPERIPESLAKEAEMADGRFVDGCSDEVFMRHVGAGILPQQGFDGWPGRGDVIVEAVGQDGNRQGRVPVQVQRLAGSERIPGMAASRRSFERHAFRQIFPRTEQLRGKSDDGLEPPMPR